MTDNFNIYLVGFRCTGKTTVGQLVAQKRGQPFVDLDAMITDRVGKSIEALVAESGWQAFRDVEKEALFEVSRQKGVAVATGGGVVLDPENVTLLRDTGRVFWLTASPMEISKRLAADTANKKQRPTLTGQSITDEVESVLKERIPLYRKAAHYVLDTDQSDIKNVTATILDHLGGIQHNGKNHK